MKAIIIYDSYFGNTEKIANAIGLALGGSDQVRVVKVDTITADDLQCVPLVIVGSPTRAFKPSPGISAFLKSLPTNSLIGARAAAFDTRAPVADINNKLLTVMVKIFGYAANPIAKQLSKKGAEVVMPPEGFFVDGTEGPLKEGELERAAAWSRKLISNNQSTG